MWNVERTAKYEGKNTKAKYVWYMERTRKPNIVEYEKARTAKYM